MKFLSFGLLVFFCLVINFYFYSCNPFSDTDYSPAAIKGVVIDSSNHSCLDSVFIQTIPSSSNAFTDTLGCFKVTNIHLGTSTVNVMLIASKQDYKNDTLQMLLHMGDTANVRIALIPTY
jgi:hypothetical protein